MNTNNNIIVDINSFENNCYMEYDVKTSSQELFDFMCKTNKIPSEILNNPLINIDNRYTSLDVIDFMKHLIILKQANPSGNNNNPIYNACSNNNCDIVKFLLSYPEVDPLDYDFRAFNIVLTNKSYEILNILLKDPRINTIKLTSEFLERIVSINCSEILELILKNITDFPEKEVSLFARLCMTNRNNNFIKSLILHTNIDINVVSYYALRGNNKQLIKTILIHPNFNPKLDHRFSHLGYASFSEDIFFDILCKCDLEIADIIINHPMFEFKYHDLNYENKFEIYNINRLDIIFLYFSNPKVGISYAENSLLLTVLKKRNMKLVFDVLDHPDFDPTSNANTIVDNVVNMKRYDIIVKLLNNPKFNPCVNNNQLLIFFVERGDEDIVNLILNHVNFKHRTLLINVVDRVHESYMSPILSCILYLMRYNTSTAIDHAILLAQEKNNISMITLLNNHPKNIISLH